MEDNINSLWINKIGDRIVGLARLVQDGPMKVRLVYFHIDPEWCHTKIPEKLLRTIQNFCRDHGGLKMILSSNTLPPWLLTLLNHNGFRFVKKNRHDFILVSNHAIKHAERN